MDLEERRAASLLGHKESPAVAGPTGCELSAKEHQERDNQGTSTLGWGHPYLLHQAKGVEDTPLFVDLAPSALTPNQVPLVERSSLLCCRGLG